MDFINAMLDKVRPKDRMKALERMNNYTQPSAQRQGYEPALCKPLSAKEQQRLNPEYAARWMLPPPMTPAAKLQADLREHFRGGQSFGPGNPWADLLPRLNEALTELDERQSGPQFIAIPRLKLGREG